MSNPNVVIDNHEVVIISIKEETGFLSSGEWTVTTATKSSMGCTGFFKVSKGSVSVNSSQNGESFNYSVHW